MNNGIKQSARMLFEESIDNEDSQKNDKNENGIGDFRNGNNNNNNILCTEYKVISNFHRK